MLEYYHPEEDEALPPLEGGDIKFDINKGKLFCNRLLIALNMSSPDSMPHRNWSLQ